MTKQGSTEQLLVNLGVMMGRAQYLEGMTGEEYAVPTSQGNPPGATPMTTSSGVVLTSPGGLRPTATPPSNGVGNITHA